MLWAIILLIQQLWQEVLRLLGLWKEALRLLGRQVLQPLIRRFPGLADTLEELGRRSLPRTLWGAKWDAEAFLAPGAEEGLEISALAAAELGAGAAIITGAVLIAIAISIIAPPILSALEVFHIDAAKAAYMSNVQREILTRGGSYPGMPPNLGRFWTPGPEEQERLMILHKLNATPATSAGTAAHDVDDQTTDDYSALIDKPSQNQPTPVSRPSVSSVTRSQSPTFDEAGMQRERMSASMSGDIIRYNQLIEEHRSLYKEHGVDPCKSGFFPQGCQ